MNKTWEELRTARSVDEKRVAEIKKAMLNEVRAFRLKDIREQANLSQSSLADELHVSQNMVSKLERGDIERTQLDTLKKYIEALGGELHLEATFGDVTYRL
jgi:DNA-binding transcriptional regulator YiaG